MSRASSFPQNASATATGFDDVRFFSGHLIFCRPMFGMLALLVGLAFASSVRAAEPLPAQRTLAAGPFKPTWESLAANYHCPEWFRDAKLGIWAHWSAQCVPEEGDWYARNMYMQGHKQYDAHLAKYGHPSESGFMEIDNLWKADHWDPEKLMGLYVAAGAKYFVALANHEDNFDTYDSRYFDWNAVRVGPHRDIVGTWAKVARAHGLHFGVSNHSSHAWHWFQTAYGYDPEGPKAGVRYDAYRLTKADGKGKWWEGLDPQDLYGGPRSGMVLPDGITTTQTAREWQDAHNLPWTESPPPDDPHFANLWFFRLQDLIDKYDPDFLYLDNTELPLGQAGLDIAAHYYNSNIARHGGKLEAVLTAKGLSDAHRPAVVQDYERSISNGGIQPQPFETDTCIGQWHYKKDIEYKSVAQVVRMLVDVVSKNGTLLLNIPQRGDGTIDDREVAFLHGLAQWTQVNGEGIFGSRPWRVFGEGPTKIPHGRGADAVIPYTSEDVRFTTKDGKVYLFLLAEPTGSVTVKSLGLASSPDQRVRTIELVGSTEPVRWRQDGAALQIEPPTHLPSAAVISYRLTLGESSHSVAR
jgi:alpha-L-fucosidase